MAQITLSPQHLPVLALIAKHGGSVSNLPRANAVARVNDTDGTVVPTASVRRLLRLGLVTASPKGAEDVTLHATTAGLAFLNLPEVDAAAA